MNRVAGADEAYLLATDIFGLQAPIQCLWVFADDPGDEAFATLHRRLATGPMNREVMRTRVPAARHRWVDTDNTLPLVIESGVVDDADIGQWFDATLRACSIDPVAGRGFELRVARTRSGKALMSLLVSHMVADGQAIDRAFRAALSESTTRSLPRRTDQDRRARLRSDVADASRQVRAAAGALGVLVPAAVAPVLRGITSGRSGGDESTNTDPGADAAGSHAAQPRMERPPVDADSTLLTLDVEAEAWSRAAKSHGGTANSLFTAIFTGALERTGYPFGPEGRRVCIAVSTRGDEADDRANASGGVWIRLAEPVDPQNGLDTIRAASKKAFADYAEQSGDLAADRVQSVARLLPRPVLARMMQAVPGPDVTVSNLGEPPEWLLTVGGSRAISYGIRAITLGRPPENRRTQGPALAAWSATYDNTVTLTVFGISPEYCGDLDELTACILAELDAWGLDARVW